MSRWVLALLVTSCTRPAPPPAPAAKPPPLFTIRDDAFGPLSAKTPATLAALRRVFAGYDVVPVNDEGVEYRVSKAGAKLFEVIPDDTGAILNIHVVTPEVEIAGHAWRVGAPFRDVDTITTCECWGDQTVCFKAGDHVAVALSKICREGTLTSMRARRALVGLPIRVAIWSPRPLAPGGYGEPAPAAEAP